MSDPMTWTQIKLLIDSNAAQRFRITNKDKTKRDGIVRQFTRQMAGRWGYRVDGDSIILGVEDPEDIVLVKQMFYASWKKRRG